MCGISGFFGLGNEDDLLRMTKALAHRGPDSFGLFNKNNVYLGHRRLSIVDLKYGHQPMIHEESETVIIYNGEIYNHLELREELIKCGHTFITSHSDTETVLHAFLEWGTDCFIRFNGMFALAIYSKKEQAIYLAKDRFGEKPLFYTINNQGFAFASELISLFHWPHFNQSLDYDNLQRYFSYGYLPRERTIFKNCNSLLPGSFARYDLKNNNFKISKYWQFELTPNYNLTEKNENELIEELRELLINAVKRRLLSDVPLGIFLSGGLDSSSVLASACHTTDPSQISAFTIGFEEKSFDESMNAKCIADYYGVKHYVSMLTSKKMQDEVYGVLNQMSEPLGDASLIPTWQLANFTRKHVTVALSGDGGDELFAGYDPFKALMPANLYRSIIPKKIHPFFRKIVKLLPVSNKNMSFDFKIKRALKGLSYPKNVQLPVWMSPLEPNELHKYFEKPLSMEEIYSDAIELYEKYPKLDDIDQSLHFFTHFYLSNDILVKADRASMMVSLESRAVFLDNDIVSFCQKLPNYFKIRGKSRKYLLKKAIQGWVPEYILKLPKKGFGIPLNLWLKDMNEPESDRAKINISSLKNAINEHRLNKGDHRLFLWALHALNNCQLSLS